MSKKNAVHPISAGAVIVEEVQTQNEVKKTEDPFSIQNSVDDGNCDKTNDKVENSEPTKEEGDQVTDTVALTTDLVTVVPAEQSVDNAEKDKDKDDFEIPIYEVKNFEQSEGYSGLNTTNIKKVAAQGNLDALLPTTCLEIRQTNRDKEDFANVPNQYEVLDPEKKSWQQKIFHGQEETKSELRVRVTSSTNRSQPFTLEVYDVETGDSMCDLRIQRNGLNDTPTEVYKCMGKLREEQLGVIIPDTGWSIVRPSYVVLDHTGNLRLKIIGPPFPLKFCQAPLLDTIELPIFEVFDPTEKELLAKITKHGDLFVREETAVVENKGGTVANDTHMSITIKYEKKQMELKLKVLVMAAGFMLDYTYYNEPSFFLKLSSHIGKCCGGQRTD